jgi:peptidylprolyl isomerase
MDHETKVTYGVIAALILLLGGVAYILQPMSIGETKDKEAVTTQKTTTTTQSGTKVTTTSTTTTMNPHTFTSATITTNKGVIEIAFATNTPNTVKNFGTLASSKFYDGVRFHRVIKNFMIQTGDPLSKDKTLQSTWGTGGPGYKFDDELYGNEQYALGTVAMANAGPNTNGSQFFIVTANPGYPLPQNYTVFGKVTKGIETALAIQEVKTNSSDRPLEDVIIEKVEVR